MVLKQCFRCMTMKNIRGQKLICKRCEEEFDEEWKPKCPNCKKALKNAIDSKTKKISKYLWESDCGCKSMKNFLLSRG